MTARSDARRRSCPRQEAAAKTAFIEPLLLLHEKKQVSAAALPPDTLHVRGLPRP